MADLVQTGFPVESEADRHLSHLLAAEPEPWFKSLIRNLKETFNPPKLAPLEVTSKPVAVKDIWGLYGHKKQSFMASFGFQVCLVGLVLVLGTNKAVQDKVKEFVPLIAPIDLAPPPVATPKKQMMGGGVGGGVFRVGGGVTAPALLAKVEPEYSEEARKAKYQGTVLLYVQVSPEGKAVNMRVLHSLGLGLDEKATEAVKKWR